MNFLPGVSLVKILIYLAIVLGLMGFGARLEHNRMQTKLDAQVAVYNQFVGGVHAIGTAAKKDAEAKVALYKANQEKANAENTAKHAADARTIAGLRAAAAKRDSRGGSVSAAPAGSKCPDGQTCFDRAEYQRAIGEFDSEARRLADEGTSVTTDLNTAKKWANQ